MNGTKSAHELQKGNSRAEQRGLEEKALQTVNQWSTLLLCHSDQHRGYSQAPSSRI